MWKHPQLVTRNKQSLKNCYCQPRNREYYLPRQQKDQAAKCQYSTDSDNDTTYRRQLPTDRRQAAGCEGQENTACRLVVTNTWWQISDKPMLANTACRLVVTNTWWQISDKPMLANTACHLVVTNTWWQFSDRPMLANTAWHLIVTNTWWQFSDRPMLANTACHLVVTNTWWQISDNDLQRMMTRYSGMPDWWKCW